MHMSTPGKAFITAVSLTGSLIIIACILQLATHPPDIQWLILAGLTLLTGSFTVKVPSIPARLSVSDTFVFTAVLLFGRCAGTVIVALDTLVGSLNARRQAHDPVKIIFNLSSAALSMWTASSVFYLVQEPNVSAPTLPDLLLPLGLLTVIYFLLNSFLVALALAFDTAGRAFEIWRHNFMWLSVNYLGAASVAALFVSYTRTIDLTALAIIVPLLVISYLTFRTALGRLEDANRHLSQINRLYLSTIETLATAIDAKDQITHGHIRRVQQLTLSLAQRLGVCDPNQLKALEAAALLHDMGKLVIPEHILNKPGRLTPAEFDRMKLHASVGAQILSSIKFPYPVVPIVRHHHENWDGSGYPDGLRGTDIPLGARILAVADCFDALTSDRPYRPRLSDEEASRILLQRRGSMYDPLVVDAFFELTSGWIADSKEIPTNAIFDVVISPAHHRQVSPQCNTDVVAAVRSDQCLFDALDTILASLIKQTGSSVAIFFVTDPKRDQIVCAHVAGHDPGFLPDIRLPVGSRVSGWVAATRSLVTNADARLDISGVVGIPDNLQKCASSAVENGREVLAVLTIYSDDPRGFSERDGQHLQSVCQQIAASDLARLLRDAMRRAEVSVERARLVH